MFKKLLYTGVVLTLVGCANTSEPTQDVTEDDVNEEQTEEASSEVKDTGYRFIENTELMEQVEASEDAIREQWDADTYTAEAPLVALDPYDVAPLSALVMFETEEPVSVTYFVEGKTEETTYPNSIEEFNTVHELPVLGLYAGVANNVHIELEDEEGNLSEHVVQIETEELPEGFYELELVESQPDNMHPGITFLNSSAGEYTAVDHLGDVRFMIKPWMANNVEHLSNGNILIILRREHDEEEALSINYDHVVEMDLLGKPYNSYLFEMDNNRNAVAFDHDIIELDNGNILGLVHDSQSEYVEDVMIEFDLDTGEVVKATDFKDLFPSDYYEDYEYQGEPSYDWNHHNAIDQTEDGESLLVSVRNHDMVVKMTYPENDIEWISVIDENWENTTRPPEEYMLEPIGDVKFHMAHHAVEEMPDQDGNDDTTDIMLFDNNRMIMRGHEEEAEKYSRAVQYRINEVDMTIEEIWSYGEERGEYSYSDIVSDADYLEETNNVLVNFGRVYNEEGAPLSHIVEVDKDTNEVIFEYHVIQTDESDRRQIYRADRLPLYAENFNYISIIEN
jgi:arylsulfate sulfotransferase